MSDTVELRHLKAFVTLARTGHFGQAADELGLSQSAVSRTIGQLEQIADVKLVERSPGVTGLTSAGRALMPGATASLAALRDGIASATRAGNATPVLGLINSLGFEWLDGLRRELSARGHDAPELRQLELIDGFEPLRGLVDVGIYPLPLVVPAELSSAILGLRRPWIALPASHRLADREQVVFADLRGEPVIAPPAHELWNHNVSLFFRAHGIPIEVGPVAMSMYEVLSHIAAGHGWTLSTSRGDFHPWDGVVFRQLADIEPIRVAAVWESNRSHDERVQRLVTALRSTTREHADEIAS